MPQIPNKKFFYFNIAFFISVVVSFTIACNDAPTEIGTTFLQDTLTANQLSETDGIIAGYQSYLYYEPLERNTGASFVGITDIYKAATFVRYIVPIDKKGFTENDIISCELYFPLDKYVIGDTNSNILNFDVIQITKY